jgi:hypothetical protein
MEWYIQTLTARSRQAMFHQACSASHRIASPLHDCTCIPAKMFERPAAGMASHGQVRHTHIPRGPTPSFRCATRPARRRYPGITPGGDPFGLPRRHEPPTGAWLSKMVSIAYHRPSLCCFTAFPLCIVVPVLLFHLPSAYTRGQQSGSLAIRNLGSDCPYGGQYQRPQARTLRLYDVLAVLALLKCALDHAPAGKDIAPVVGRPAS